jgi:2-oxoglutarate dehydrogenase E2 component (dihydrolipoamide succinyltransferase)
LADAWQAERPPYKPEIRRENSSMSIEVKIPSVGESISSGVLAAWLKNDGDYVRANEPLLTLETDKVSTEVGATAAGRLIIQVKQGEEVKIGETVGLIEEGVLAPPDTIPAIPAPDKLAPAPEAAPLPTAQATAQNLAAGQPPLSPAVRRLAEEENLPTAGVAGSGKGGRLTKGDLIDQIENRAAKPPEAAAAPAKSAPPAPSAGATERTTRRKLTPLRRKIAAQLVMAQQTAAILTTFNECDMSAVMALRSKMQDAFTRKHGVKLGFMSFFIKAIVEALRAVPSLNGQLEGDEFVQNHYYDIGVAVGTDKGLIVPVVRDADHKSFAQIEKDLGAYATKAREGKIGIDDLTGGVFTVSNGGTYGSLLSTPILNPPQSGILGMHNIVQRPVAVDGAVVIRPMMYLALSYDHRVVDGKEAVTALVRIKDCIEDPSRMLLEV